MISAVDSSVILDVVTADPRHADESLRDYFSGLKLLDPSSPG